jgi:hypothetical protein
MPPQVSKNQRPDLAAKAPRTRQAQLTIPACGYCGALSRPKPQFNVRWRVCGSGHTFIKRKGQ